jgi:hypothetical protein
MGGIDADAGAVGAEVLGMALEVAYDEYPRIEAAFQEMLVASLEPRGPEALVEIVGTLRVLDNGVAVDESGSTPQGSAALHRGIRRSCVPHHAGGLPVAHLPDDWKTPRCCLRLRKDWRDCVCLTGQERRHTEARRL